MFERKALESTDVQADVDKRIIRGYAAAFGNVDAAGDIIVKGAFAKSIETKFTPFVVDGRSDIKTLYDHYDPIGLPTKMHEDDKGLYVEARVSKTAKGDEVLELIRDNVVDKMSIGFIVTKSEDSTAEGQGNVRLIQEVDLYEFGPVLWPANDETSVEVVKSIHAINRQLKAGGVSARDAERLAAMLTLLHDALTAYAQEEEEEEEQPGPADEEKSKAHLLELKNVLAGFSGQLKSLTEQTTGVFV